MCFVNSMNYLNMSLCFVNIIHYLNVCLCICSIVDIVLDRVRRQLYSQAAETSISFQMNHAAIPPLYEPRPEISRSNSASHTTASDQSQPNGGGLEMVVRESHSQ